MFVGSLRPRLSEIVESMVGEKAPYRTFRLSAVSLLLALERERVLEPGAISRDVRR
jgi:hypothetical protein